MRRDDPMVPQLADIIWAHKGRELRNRQAASLLGVSSSASAEFVTRLMNALMPWVAPLFCELHPGYAVSRPGDGRFVVTDNPDEISGQIVRRAKKAITVINRTTAEAGVWRQHSTSPVQIRIAAILGLLEQLTQDLERDLAALAA